MRRARRVIPCLSGVACWLSNHTMKRPATLWPSSMSRKSRKRVPDTDGLIGGADGSEREKIALLQEGLRELPGHPALLLELGALHGAMRSEERRVGKECRSRWLSVH